MGSLYRSLLQNHVLANLTFVLVLVIGLVSYMKLPRQQDPTINFNWIVITTVLPGASALDVEKKVTDPIEDAVRKIQDINFMSSNSRESISSIMVRFQEIDDRSFDKRVADLRREIQVVIRDGNELMVQIQFFLKPGRHFFRVIMIRFLNKVDGIDHGQRISRIKINPVQEGSPVFYAYHGHHPAGDDHNIRDFFILFVLNPYVCFP